MKAFPEMSSDDQIVTALTKPAISQGLMIVCSSSSIVIPMPAGGRRFFKQVNGQRRYRRKEESNRDKEKHKALIGIEIFYHS